MTALKQRAKGFTGRSYDGLFKFCTGAIDGLAIKVKAPVGSIHCTFGIFVRRWGIFWKSLQYDIKFVKSYIAVVDYTIFLITLVHLYPHPI